MHKSEGVITYVSCVCGWMQKNNTLSNLTLYLARTTKVARPAVLHDDVISTDFRV